MVESGPRLAVRPARVGRTNANAAWIVTLTALAVRLGVVAWAAKSIPPAADGQYYHALASRIASGQGYTWLWPDGVVTAAAHYPVGYPAILGAAYAVFGIKPVVAMIVNALIGTAGAWATHDILARSMSDGTSSRRSRRLAFAGGLAVALHPALVPYTAALMTEGVTAAFLMVAAAFAERAHLSLDRKSALRDFAVCGVVLGVATLVRPQSIVLAPVFGWLATRSGAPADVVEATLTSRRSDLRAGMIGALLASALALAVCAPWTARNCVRMQRCALVSVNGGWNLAIGTQTTGGGWQEMSVPDACKEVFAEAAKDECFGREAEKTILADPLRWLRRVPAKLRVTFDYFGAAPWYLNAANAVRFPYRAKVALGTIETIASRLLLIAALVTVRKLEGPRRLLREAVTGFGLLSCFLAAGAMGYLACALAILLLGPRALNRAPRIVPICAAVLVATAGMHAVFFGAGRYGLVVVPFVTALAFVRPERRSDPIA
jgi:hypothetical protein